MYPQKINGRFQANYVKGERHSTYIRIQQRGVDEMNLAEANKETCDDMLMDLAAGDGYPNDATFTVYYPTLNTREIVTQDKDALALAMEWLTGSFEFEAKQMLVENAYGFEITLPRMMIG